MNVNGYRVVGGGALAAVLFSGGCVTTSAPPDMSSMPPDFSVDVTVLSGDDEAGARPVHLRTSRYVVLADGSLRASISTDLDADDFPPFVRQLDRDQIAALWEVARTGGLTDPANVDVLGNIELVRAQPGQMTYLIVITAHGDRVTEGRTRTLSDLPHPGIERLTRALAMLAWASDDPDRSARRAPRRYDFGPDPHARYRDDGSTD